MVFTPEKDAFILMAHFRSGTRNPDGSWSYSLQSCMEQYAEAFPGDNVSYSTFKHRKLVVVKKFEDKNCICKSKSSGRPTILSEDVLEDIRGRVVRSPNKSIPKLAAQSGIYAALVIKNIFNFRFVGLSVGTCHKALQKCLRMHPYKVSVVQQLYPQDFNQRVQYCEWFNQHLHNNNLLDVTFFTDEAWVHLSGYVNSQNYRTWGTENPHVFVETTLHPQKIGIWVAVSRRRILGPIFFRETVTAERYRGFLEEAIGQMHDDELTTGYFQQDGATAHTANATIEHLETYYGDRVISRGLWPPRSPDLTPLDYYLFGRIKNNIFKNRIHTIEELEARIIEEIQNITAAELEKVFENMKRRVNLCLEQGGGHFQHLL